MLSLYFFWKYEEIYPPDVNEFVYITDNTYTRDEVLKMEHLILKVLSFDVATPTCNLFCELFLKDAGYTEEKDQVFSLTMVSIVGRHHSTITTKPICMWQRLNAVNSTSASLNNSSSCSSKKDKN